MKSKHAVPVVVVLLIIAGTLALLFLGSREREGNSTALLSSLPKAKLSLTDGIQQAAKPPESAISAKFELDDKGSLSLSIYTAEKGVAIAADENVLKEVSGNAENDEWNPVTEVIKDPSDLTEAKTQLALMSDAKVSLLDVAKKAEGQGTLISVKPESKQGNLLFEVTAVSQGKVKELSYDTAGNLISNNEEEGRDDDD